MLYEGRTLEETFAKVFAKSKYKRLGKPSTYGKPGNAGGKYGSTGKYNSKPGDYGKTINPNTANLSLNRIRRAAVGRAKAWIANASIRIGAREKGMVIILNRRTGEVRELIDGNAGVGGVNDFVFNFRWSSRRDVILVFAHSHPKESEAGGWRDRRQAQERNAANEGISGNRNDETMLEIAPMVIKTPTGIVRDFWRPGGYD